MTITPPFAAELLRNTAAAASDHACYRDRSGDAMPPLALTDRQMGLIQHVARAVPIQYRDELLQRLARRLTPEPSDAAVLAALNIELDMLTTPTGLK
jgi:hypothetical protein